MSASAGISRRIAGKHRARTPAPAPRPTQPAVVEDESMRIHRTIFESVVSQRLVPGTKLREVELCEVFGVGRTIVRKALQSLAHDHIVELRPNRGAVVAAPTPEETLEIFVARRALENALMPMAVANATKADLAELRRLLRDEHDALHDTDQSAWARRASMFHLQVARLARNAILHRYLAELVSRCALIVAVYEPPGNAACEHDEHERIVTLMAEGDAAGAARLMDDHLRDLERRISLERAEPSTDLGRMLGLR